MLEKGQRWIVHNARVRTVEGAMRWVMRLRRIVAGASILAILLVSGLGAKERKLVERWADPEFQRTRFQKLLVIAITSDAEARKNFENLFVSHLRGKGIEGVTSHSMVADLGQIEPVDRQEILRLIEERQIDGAISIRAVPLKTIDEAQWAAAWSAEVRGDGTLRRLIETTLPGAGGKARRYGVEAALWNAADGNQVWGGRTDPYSLDGMRKGAAEFVQLVMHGLDLDGLIR